MSKTKITQMIKDFYTFFNNSELEKLFALFSNDFEHQLNYCNVEKGKALFIDYIQTSKKHYKEEIDNYTLMIADDGLSGSSRFIVKGTYLSTDSSGIPANGQAYQLEVFNYFEIKEGQFTKGKAFFDENEFKRQISVA